MLKRFLIATAAASALIGVAAAQVTIVKAGKLIDPDTAKVLIDQRIVIRNNRIEKVGTGLAEPAGAKVIDLGKMTVLPGLIDCHTHLADGAHNGEPFGQFKKTAAQVALESVPNARGPVKSSLSSVE